MNAILPDQLAAIDRYLSDDFTIEALYESLADSAGLAADDINRAEEGKIRFSIIWARYKQRVCTNPVIRAYIRNPSTSDATMIAAQVANILVNVPGVNIIVIACLGVRIGLRQLCADSTE